MMGEGVGGSSSGNGGGGEKVTGNAELTSVERKHDCLEVEFDKRHTFRWIPSESLQLCSVHSHLALPLAPLPHFLPVSHPPSPKLRSLSFSLTHSLTRCLARSPACRFFHPTFLFPLSLPYIWLRDSCPRAFDPKTGERIFSVAYSGPHMPSDTLAALQDASHAIDAGIERRVGYSGLVVVWNGGIESRFQVGRNLGSQKHAAAAYAAYASHPPAASASDAVLGAQAHKASLCFLLPSPSPACAGLGDDV